MGLLVDWTQLRKESLSLRNVSEETYKTESKENKDLKNRISKDCKIITKGVTYVYWEYWKEKTERKDQKNCLKQ